MTSLGEHGNRPASKAQSSRITELTHLQNVENGITAHEHGESAWSAIKLAPARRAGMSPLIPHHGAPWSRKAWQPCGQAAASWETKIIMLIKQEFVHWHPGRRPQSVRSAGREDTDRRGTGLLFAVAAAHSHGARSAMLTRQGSQALTSCSGSRCHFCWTATDRLDHSMTWTSSPTWPGEPIALDAGASPASSVALQQPLRLRTLRPACGFLPSNSPSTRLPAIAASAASAYRAGKAARMTSPLGWKSLPELLTTTTQLHRLCQQ